MTPTRLDPMEDLVIQLSRRDEARTHPVAGLDRLTTLETTEAFLRLADHHGVGGLVLHTLSKLPEMGPLPDLISREFQSQLKRLKTRSAIWEIEEERILSSFRSRGLDPLVLKGGALRHYAYRAGVERSMGDLDLLVVPDHVPEALDTLRSLGYQSEYPEEARVGFREHHYHERVEHPNGFLVEIHWGLTRPGAPGTLDPHEFLRRARSIRGSSGEVLRVPSSEDLLLHFVSQIQLDRFRSFRKFVDVDRVVAAAEDLDWEYVRSRARGGNLHVSLSVALRVANLLLLTPSPGWALEGTDLGALTRQAVTCIRPLRHLMKLPGKGDIAADDLIWLWSLPTSNLRRLALLELASGTRDPLNWVWEKKDDPEIYGQNWLGGFSRIMKILTVQLWVAGRGLGSRIASGRSPATMFWQSPPTAS